MKTKMQDTNIIWDTAKKRRIDYGLIDKINRECELKARKAELEAKIAKKESVEKEKQEEPAAEPLQTDNINYIKTPDELRDIKGNYSLQKGIYTIDFEIIVPSGKTLVLQPGVQLYFTKDAGITCEGRFEARGTKGLEVLLTAKDEDERWKNLYLKGGAEGVLDYAKFSYGNGRTSVQGSLSGGAVFLHRENDLNPSLTINNSCFENNYAWGNGGVIYNVAGNVTIKENNRFEKNSSEGDGGAIYNLQGEITIGKKNGFEKNSATWGGGIYNYAGNIIIKENNRFKKNSARSKGGAIFNLQGDITVARANIFEKNSANKGGAIGTYQGRLNMDKLKNTFIGNKPGNIYHE